MIGGAEASGKIFSDEFDPDSASVSDPEVRTTLYFMETLGTLVRNGLFNRELANDWIWVKGAWDRVGPAALRAREALGQPKMFENFESLAEGWN